MWSGVAEDFDDALAWADVVGDAVVADFDGFDEVVDDDEDVIFAGLSEPQPLRASPATTTDTPVSTAIRFGMEVLRSWGQLRRKG